MTTFVDGILHSSAYVLAMTFLVLYPLLSALNWIAGSLIYARRREGGSSDFYELDEHPFVSVLIPAHDEEGVIVETVECVLELDWPAFEVIVVDDGSSDRTSELLAPYASQGRIRLVTKQVNEGKAMALNDAWPLARGEIVLIVDADGRPNRDVLRWMVPHFVKVPRVAAVTGNPRVVNTTTLLAKMQAIEFSATVSVLRRAQVTWGRVMTFSGVCTALRRSAVESAGRFRPEMVTEDIDMAWQLQTRFFDVRYEPRAVFAMQVPETMRFWWRQRARWARGLGQVLRHARADLHVLAEPADVARVHRGGPVQRLVDPAGGRHRRLAGGLRRRQLRLRDEPDPELLGHAARHPVHHADRVRAVARRPLRPSCAPVRGVGAALSARLLAAERDGRDARDAARSPAAAVGRVDLVDPALRRRRHVGAMPQNAVASASGKTGPLPRRRS
jgi:GT2 family glycosyltransferase